MIDYRALEALSAVVSHQGFERAANILNVSQSAVSQRIKQLEARLGRPVLIRKTPPEPTELGLQLITHLQTVQHLEKDLDVSDNNTNKDRVHARIAINADSIATWFAEALGRITDEMDVDIILADQDKGIELMKRAEVLACLCSDGNAVNGAKVDRLGVMRYRVYASQDFILRFNVLGDFQLLHEMPCLIFNQDDNLQHLFLKQLGQASPKNINLCPSSEGFLQMIAQGCGYGMVPEMQARHLVKAGKIIDIAPKHFIDMPLYWHSWRSSGLVMKRLRTSVIKTAHRWLEQDH